MPQIRHPSGKVIDATDAEAKLAVDQRGWSYVGDEPDHTFAATAAQPPAAPPKPEPEPAPEPAEENEAADDADESGAADEADENEEDPA